MCMHILLLYHHNVSGGNYSAISLGYSFCNKGSIHLQ